MGYFPQKRRMESQLQAAIPMTLPAVGAKRTKHSEQRRWPAEWVPLKWRADEKVPGLYLLRWSFARRSEGLPRRVQFHGGGTGEPVAGTEPLLPDRGPRQHARL